TRHLDHVDTQGEGDECVLRQAELAAADEGDAVGEPGAGEGRVDPGEGETEGESDRIAEDEGSRAGPPFAAVHGDEVHAPLAVGHRRREVLPEVDVADRRLDTDREARRVRDPFDEVEHRVDVVELAVPGGAGAVPALGGAAGLGDLPADLRPGEHATEAGLRSLAELDLDGSYRRRRHDLDELVEVEPAVLVAAAEVRGPDLEDQV